MAGILSSLATPQGSIFGGQATMPVQSINLGSVPTVPALHGPNPFLQQLVSGIGRSLMSPSSQAGDASAQAAQMAQQQQQSMMTARARMQQAVPGFQPMPSPFRTGGF